MYFYYLLTTNILSLAEIRARRNPRNAINELEEEEEEEDDVESSRKKAYLSGVEAGSCLFFVLRVDESGPRRSSFR